MKVSYQNRQYWYCWGYEGENGRVEIYETTNASLKDPGIVGGKVGDYTIYKKAGGGYLSTPYSGYYSTTDSEDQLQQYFANVVQEITTKVTTKVVLESDTILRHHRLYPGRQLQYHLWHHRLVCGCKRQSGSGRES